MRKIPSVIIALLVALNAGCSRNVAGGNPSVPLSSKAGTTQTFESDEPQVTAAVSNAFSDGSYRGMQLYPAQEEAYLVDGWNPTNGAVLFPLMGDITNVPLKSGVTVPYRCSFYIVVSQVDSNHTKVTVTSIGPKVADGEEPGVHGGWARHMRAVPPVLAEEQNVLAAISQRMPSAK